MDALGGDSFVGVEELDEAQADRARAGGVAAAGEVEIVVVLDLGPRDDLVELAVVARVLEVHGDDRAHRRRIGHLDQDPARGDVARDGDRVAVQLAADHDQEGLIEPRMDALLDDGDRDGGQVAVLEDVSQRQGFAALHKYMIRSLRHEVKELTLSYISRAAPSNWLRARRSGRFSAC